MATLAKYYPISGDERIVSIKNGAGTNIPMVAAGAIVAPKRDKGNRLIALNLEIGVKSTGGQSPDLGFETGDNIIDIVAKLPAGVIRNLVSKAAAGTPMLTAWADVRIIPLYVESIGVQDADFADLNNAHLQQVCARSNIVVNTTAQTAAIRLEHLAAVIDMPAGQPANYNPWALIFGVEIDWMHSIRS